MLNYLMLPMIEFVLISQKLLKIPKFSVNNYDFCKDLKYNNIS